MISCCTIHLADIPIGFTGAPIDSCGPTLRGSSILTKVLLHTLRTHMSTCQAKNQKNSTDVKCFHLSDTSMKYKCPSVYLTRIQPNTQDIIVSDNTTNEQWHKDKCSDHKIFPYDNTASAFSSQYD